MASIPFSVSCEADEIIAEIARIDASLGGVRPDTIVDMRGVSDVHDDDEPTVFSDVPDHSMGRAVTGIEAVEERLARLEAFVARWACIVGAPGTEYTVTPEALLASGFDPRGGV